MQVEFGAISGLQSYLDALPDAASQAAKFALNDVAQGPGLAVFRKAVADSANFPPGYLTDSRLGVTSKATSTRLATTITGRFRATSLARFAQSPTVGKTGVRVEVRRGHSVDIKRAFIIRLRAGKTLTNDSFNLGLAIRLKPGEKLRNTVGARPIALDKGLYLLYGPSVDQVFREVGSEEAPQVLKLVETEFYRQFFRLTKRAR